MSDPVEIYSLAAQKIIPKLEDMSYEMIDAEVNKLEALYKAIPEHHRVDAELTELKIELDSAVVRAADAAAKRNGEVETNRWHCKAEEPKRDGFVTRLLRRIGRLLRRIGL